MLEVKSLTFTYEGQNQICFPDISLSNNEGLIVLGNSGSGKTTLINLIAGLIKPDSGDITLNQTKYNELSLDDLDIFRGKNIGLIFQKPHFIRNLNVLENLSLSTHLSRNKVRKEIFEETLSEVGLSEKVNVRPNELSEGEQQRLSIAMALVKEPSIILADEPTSSLDDNNCNKVISLLKAYSENKGCKLIIVTHDSRIKDLFKKKISL
ncbi:ATP-binding cassette domain-containing protein [Bacteroidota bacterium]|nr:ATP-binding cassette domain-containing protein [Bacteroidota bacterium]